jgi:hypothetical protein
MERKTNEEVHDIVGSERRVIGKVGKRRNRWLDQVGEVISLKS